jgi:uroporphyrinogen-III synthase
VFSKDAKDAAKKRRRPVRRGGYVLHTGPLDKAPAWIEAMKDAGVEAIALPVVRTDEAPPDVATDELVARDAPYALVVLTSKRAAYVLPRWKRHLAYAPVAVVGRETAYEAAAYGFPAAIVGDTGASELAARLLDLGDLSGKAILWPCGSAPLPTLRERLEAAGARVTAPVVYRTAREDVDLRKLKRRLREAEGVVFTSPSGVDAFSDAAEAAGEGEAARRLFAGCLGNSTAEAAERRGFVLKATASRPDPIAMADVMRRRLPDGI